MTAAGLMAAFRARSRAEQVAIALAFIVGFGLGGLAITALVGPSPPQLSAASTGDDELGREVLRLLGDETTGLESMMVLEIDGDRTRHTGFGQQLDGAPVDLKTAFEIGSVAKPLTGMLLATLIEDEEVEPDITLAELTSSTHKLTGRGAQATAEELATHRSGYPRIPLTSIARGITFALTANDPYQRNVDELLEASDNAFLITSEDFTYSNLGMSALGQGLASHQDRPYADLVDQRVLQPLGMDDTVFLVDGSALPVERVDGRTAKGQSTEPWLAEGWQPAGVGVWSTAEDLGLLVSAVLAQTAPGLSATEGRFPIGDGNKIGYGWLLIDVDGRVITFHNGGTGGYRSYVGIDREADRAVVILSNSTRTIDPLGTALLTEQSTPVPGPSTGIFGWWTAIVLTLVPLGGLYRLFRLHRNEGGNDDRHGLVRNLAAMTSLLLGFRTLGPWDTLPTLIWSLAATAVLAMAAVTAMTWRSTPTIVTKRPRLRWFMTAVQLILGGAFVFLCRP